MATIHGQRGTDQAAALLIRQAEEAGQRIRQGGAQQRMQNAVAAEVGDGAVEQQKLGGLAVLLGLGLNVLVQEIQLFLTISGGADAGQKPA